MTFERPPTADVWRAIEAYLAIAYDGAPPPPVAERLARLRAAPEGSFWDGGVFERGEDRDALRLGNRFYPHMKLAVIAAPGGGAVFAADTHDRHFLDLAGASDPRLAELMDRNQAIARAVEAAWEAAGLRTVRACLREQQASWMASRT